MTARPAETVVGHGVDIVDLARVRERLMKGADHFLAAFTPAEIAGADAEPARAAYFGGRFAGKEAVAKALGTGFSRGVSWLDIEIVRSESGAPRVLLSGAAAQHARVLGITGWHVSLSHSESFAVASAIAVAAHAAS